MPRVEYCPCCGRKIVDYKHQLNKILVQDLEYLLKAGGTATLRELSDKFEMTHSEMANFQKLRYFGLVEKVGPRVYGITGMGRGFLKGLNTSPLYVITRDSVVIQTGPEVTIEEVDEMIQNREDYEAQASR